MTTTLLVLLLTVTGATPASSSDSLRLAIVDTSLSMEGDRLKTVRDELTMLAQREPPSPARPIGLVTFADQAQPARLFTDAAAFAKALAELRTGGHGTRIAAGLMRAYEELHQRLRARRVVILLYTDFEDADQAGIAAAEIQLGSLFTLRGQQGLAQQVFVKTWGSATAPLDTRLSRLPHVEPVDEYDLALVPITFQPAVTVTTVERLADPRQIRITFVPAVVGRVPHFGRPPAVRFSCLNQGANGDIDLVIPFGNKRIERQLVVPTTAVDEQAGRLVLRFGVRLESRASASPQAKPIAMSTLEVLAKLPPLQLRNRLSATLECSDPPVWCNPLEQRARFRALLSIKIEALDGAVHMDRSGDFIVVPEAGAKLIAGKQFLHTPGPGQFRFPLEFEVTPNRRPIVGRLPSYCIRLVLKPAQHRPHSVYDPPELRLTADQLAPPAAVVTQIFTRVTGVTRPRWLRIDDQATFSARLEFDVRGPVPPGTRLNLIAPAGIEQVSLVPAELHSGRQQVTLSAMGRLPVTAAPQSLSFMISPIRAATSTVRLVVPNSIDVLLPPLAAGQLVDLDSPPDRRRLIATAYGDALAILKLRPGLLEFPQADLSPRLSARLESLDHQLKLPATRLAMGRSAELSFSLPAPLRPVFFSDVRQVFSVRLYPDHSTPAIRPSQLTIEVVQEARLKRLLVKWSWPLSIAASTALCGLVFYRLRQPI